jgi:ABC-type branched-subunit amino acid transport system ATPase component
VSRRPFERAAATLGFKRPDRTRSGIFAGLELLGRHASGSGTAGTVLSDAAGQVSPGSRSATAGAAAPLLSCRGVEVAYDGVQVLFGVDLDLYEGEIVALLGTNGAGKSTLLRAISGLTDPIGGTITFDGRDITHLGPVPTVKLGIVQVPGGKSIFPTLTVAEHFRMTRWLLGDLDDKVVDARIASVVKRFPRLGERWSQMAGNLSGGEAQQLGLGMALVTRPRLLAIDELTLGLAPAVVEDLLTMVQEIHDLGATVVLVEQSVNVALEIAERAYFMEKGEVRFSGKTADLLQRDDILRAVFLSGTASIVPADEAAAAAAVPAGAEAAGSMAAAPASPSAPAPASANGKRATVLEVRGLTRRFGPVAAVSDVSFTLREGEILGLIGPNGAGKTTIFDLLSGLLVPDEGVISLKGRDVTRWSPSRRAAFGLGRSFQDARLFPSLTVAENIAIGLERHIETRDHLAAVLCLPAIQESEMDVDYTVDQLIEMLSLEAFRDKFVAELSTGSRRIVDLAMAIAHQPKVLILDEPSSGIAQKEAEALGPLMKRIRQETGCSMLVIEHDMPLITSVSDEIVALDTGRVIARGTPQEVITDPKVVASYLGTRGGVHQGGNDLRDQLATTTEIPVVGAASGDK